MRNLRAASWRRRLALLFAVAVAVACGARAAAQEGALAGRDITLTPVGDDGVTAVSFDPTAPAPVLGVERRAVRQGETVAQLLKAGGIAPDAEAFGLVYDLNPSLKSVKAVAPGTELVLPTVRTGQDAPPPKGLVALSVDAGLKKELLAKIEALDRSAAAVGGFGVDHFKSADEQRATLKSLREIGNSFAVIRSVIKGRVLPVTSEALAQLNAEAELTQAALDRLARPDQKATAGDLDSIRLVEADLLVKRRALTDVRAPGEPPGRWPDVTVVVRMLAPDGGQVGNLRVYYVYEALRGRATAVKSFNEGGSPTRWNMPEANYLIWAGRPDEAAEGAALTDVKRLAVRKTSDEPLRLDLFIIH
jgi:hypothetical protein